MTILGSDIFFICTLLVLATLWLFLYLKKQRYLKEREEYEESEMFVQQEIASGESGTATLIHRLIKMEFSYQGGRMHGLVRYWHQDGTIKHEMIYINGKKRPDLLVPEMKLARVAIFGKEIL